MRFFLLALSLSILACGRRQVQWSDLANKLAEAEYIPSGDGWAEARRRRLVRRYLEALGFQVRAEQRAYDDGRLESKYRETDLFAHAASSAQQAKRVRVTLSLLLPEKQTAAADFINRQKQCDRVLLSVLEKAGEFSDIELVTSPVCFGLTRQGEAQE